MLKTVIPIKFKRLTGLLKEEQGQGIVEFAVVLPILLLLTLGTVMLTLSYMQKAQMNGLAFQAARVAAVRRNPDFDAAKYTLEQYKQRSGQVWIDTITARSEERDNGTQVRLTKPAQRLDVLANLISGQPGSDQPRELGAQMHLRREIRDSGSERPQTYSEVSYRYQASGVLPWLKLLEGLPNGILDADTQMADDTGGAAQGDKVLGLEPPNANLKEFYDDRGWDLSDYNQNTEKEAGQFARMHLVGENFKKIQAGMGLVDLLNPFKGFTEPLKALLGPGADKIAGQVASTMETIANQTDSNLRQSFGGESQ